ncbi:hypothetical protein KR032_008633 [Drosophila birchii]|nr:hypothetical protein KR032_008633 [Drosophila birchii]
MFTTRKQVDEHVHKILANVPPGNQRDIKGLAVARLYYKIQEYPKAIEYLNCYLRAKDEAVPHKLIAHSYKLLKTPDLQKALQHYQRCIQLNPRQPEVIKEVCQLLVDEKSVFNKECAKYWLDLAASENLSDNEAVVSLRMRVNLTESSSNGNGIVGDDGGTSGADNEDAFEMIMHKELQARPQDVNVRVRLMRSYVEKNQLDQAFKYAYKVELEANGCTSQSSEWYAIVWVMLTKKEDKRNAKDWRFWQLALHTCDRLLQLSLESGNPLAETSSLLFRFDQYMNKFSTLLERSNDAPQRELHLACVEHYAGQLLLQTVSLIFKRELLGNKNKWMGVVRSILPLLLLGYQVHPLQEQHVHPWMKHCDAEQKQLLQLWRQQGSFRCAQLGRILLGCLDRSRADQENQKNNNIQNTQSLSGLFSDSEELLNCARQQCLDKTWRSQLYQILFTHAEYKLKEQTSHLVRHPRLQTPLFEWPDLAEIETYEQQALLLQPRSLAQHVYLALGTDIDSLGEAPRVLFYEEFRRDVKQNLSYCGHDSISQLDVDLYLYATVIQAQRKLELLRNLYDSSYPGSRNAAARPHMMPYANLLSQLATPEQSSWWDIVLRLHRNQQMSADANRAEQRAQLQLGLEAVRGVNGPKADAIIIFQLGKILQSRSDRCSLEPRIDVLYRQGFSMLRRHQQQQQFEAFVRIFKYGSASSTIAWNKLQSLAEHAVSYFSAKMFKAGQFDQFVEEVRGLDLPMATYLQAEAYRLLEDSGKANRASRARYSERRQECLQQTQQLLRNDSRHALSSVIQRELRRCQQQNRSSLLQAAGDDSFGTPDQHNNSSTYEDAEDDFYAGASLSANRSTRRQQFDISAGTPVTSAVVVAQPSEEIEQTLKQISKSICLVTDNMAAMRQDITTLTERFNGLEDMIKKMKITASRETPTRDVDPAAALGLDDLFIIEDALAEQHQQQQQQQQQHQAAVHQVVPPQYGGPNPAFYNGVQSHTPSAQDRFLPGPYGSPMFNQNQMYNYYAAQAQAQFMRTPPAPPGGLPPANLFGPRNPNYGLPSIFPPPAAGAPPVVPPFMDPMGNFNQPPAGSLIPPPPQPTTQQQAPAPLNLAEAKPPALATPGFFNSPAAPTFGVPTIQLPPQTKPLTVPPAVAAPPPTVPAAAAAAVVPAPAPGPAPVNLVAPALSAPVPAPIKAPQVALPATVPPPASVPALFNRALNNQPVEKEPPANVVITSSDPLPKPTGASGVVQPTLSVTIPAQHIKPSLVQPTAEPQTQVQTQQPLQPTLPASGVFNFNMGNAATESPFSFKMQVAKAAAEKQKEQELEQAAAAEANKSGASDLNKSVDANSSLTEDYDPRPDFKAIIPLPDEVEVRTGEENEEVKFSYRAKLFRYAEKEWKERGTGLIKILRDNNTGVSRVLMRRDQTHKVCANHTITADMTLSTPSQDKDKKSFLWAANDFADEQLTLEKFLVRFKTPETAEEFRVAFVNANAETKVKFAQANKEPTAFPSAPAPASAPAPFSLAKSFVTSTPAAANPAVNKPSEQAKTKPATEPSLAKSLFGGLPSTAASSANTTATPSPFANFSFSGLGTESKASPSPFGNLSFSNASNSTLFTTAQIPKDSTLQNQNQTETKTSTSDAEEEYEPTAQFAPVIPLPELVEVVTGEENEEVLFEHRAKLLRYDKEANEWKERGLGDMKVLRDRSSPDQVRLLMRRDKVLKLCCNQRLTPETKFTFAVNQKSAVTWASMDYADEELTNALLCLRFKTPEICQNFLDAVQKAQEGMGKGKEDQKQEKDEKKQPEKPIKGFGDAFKPKAGSWSCKACYTSNGQDQLYCLACQEPKDDTVPPKQPGLDQGNALNLSTSSSASGKFSFGFAPATLPASGGFIFGAPKEPVKEKPAAAATTVTATASAPASTTTSGFGDAFKPKAGSWSCTACYVSNSGESLYCSACETTKDDTVPKKENNTLGSGLTLPASSQFSFGFAAKPKDQQQPTTNSSIFGFSAFNSQAPTAVASAASLGGSSGGFSFSMPSKPTQQQPKSPAAADGEDNNDGYHEEEENNAYFAPVIPLPDKIDVKTGEEDEELLFVHRAKLYRHTEGEWKERGLGDVKILRHIQTKKLRVVMRREQVFKICLNHVLNNEVVYKPKDEKSLLFAAHDFSEGESVLERFTLRFKNHDVVEEFSKAVKEALNGTAVAIKDNRNTSFSTRISEAIKQQDAEQVPSSCPGCRGCSPDEFVFAAASSPVTSAAEDDVNPALPMFLPALQLPKPTATPIVKASSLGATTNLSFSAFGNLAVSEVTKAPSSPAFLFGNAEKPASEALSAPLFGGNQQAKGNVLGSIFGSTNTDQSSGWDSAKSIFSGGGQQQKDETTPSKFIFGGTAKIESPQQPAAAPPIAAPEIQKSIFGGPTVFGAKLPASGFLFGGGSNAPIFGQKEAVSSFADLSQQVKEKEDKPSATATTAMQSFSYVGGDANKDGKNVPSATFGSTITDLSKTTGSTTFADFGSKSGETFADFAKKAGNDFADLSAKSQGTPVGFNKGSTGGGFYNLTHQNEFKNFQSPQSAKNDSQRDGDGDGEANNDENYDPQYDPIIELPDEIVVTTGEENEKKLFGERVKLYRYDNDSKAWKERGCGELKVLEHPEMKSYRLVLRQEQVHKLLLNMKITGSIHFDYMSGQKKSLLWAGHNFAADAEGKISADGAVERLACRFAKEEIASVFLAKANNCIERARSLEDSREEQDGATE